MLLCKSQSFKRSSSTAAASAPHKKPGHKHGFARLSFISDLFAEGPQTAQNGRGGDKDRAQGLAHRMRKLQVGHEDALAAGEQIHQKFIGPAQAAADIIRLGWARPWPCPRR